MLLATLLAGSTAFNLPFRQPNHPSIDTATYAASMPDLRALEVAEAVAEKVAEVPSPDLEEIHNSEQMLSYEKNVTYMQR